MLRMTVLHQPPPPNKYNRCAVCGSMTLINTMSSAGHHIILSHPDNALPGNAFVGNFTFTNLWADNIMSSHARYTDILHKLTPQESIGLDYGRHVEMLFVPDLHALGAAGFQMADFWMDFRVDNVMPWDRWYVQVNRCAAKGWQLHIVACSENGTGPDHFPEAVWLAYKNYFNRCSPEAYDDRAFQGHKAQLLSSARTNFREKVKDLSRVSALGDVYRNPSYNGECMLWADSNDTRYKERAAELWTTRRHNGATCALQKVVADKTTLTQEE